MLGDVVVDGRRTAVSEAAHLPDAAREQRCSYLALGLADVARRREPRGLLLVERFGEVVDLFAAAEQQRVRRRLPAAARAAAQRVGVVDDAALDGVGDGVVDFLAQLAHVVRRTGDSSVGSLVRRARVR